jgi:hypothetical protein
VDIFDAIRHFFGIDSNPRPVQPVVPDDPCNAVSACVDARGRLQTARTAITPLCDGIRIAKSVAAAAAAVIFSPWMAVAIVVAIAAWALFDGLAGAAVVALLALYATLLVVYLGALAVVAGLAPALDKRRNDFQDALKDILTHCSPDCQGDISQPDCRLQ